MILNIFALVLALFHFVGPMPTNLGVHQGQLSVCESPAHCARLDWERKDPIQSLNELAKFIRETPRNEIIELRSDYLHATASSRIFGSK